jgi:hypothetical protein
MKRSNQIEHALAGISTEQFAMVFDPKSPECEMESGIEVAGNYDDRMVAVKINMRFLFEDKVFMQITISCGFEISEESWSALSNNGAENVVLEKGFVANLISVVLGTMRGVLHAKTENTPFNHYSIPLVNTDLIEGADFVIEKS